MLLIGGPSSSIIYVYIGATSNNGIPLAQENCILLIFSASDLLFNISTFFLLQLSDNGSQLFAHQCLLVVIVDRILLF
jgi:hypothetical protein